MKRRLAPIPLGLALCIAAPSVLSAEEPTKLPSVAPTPILVDITLKGKIAEDPAPVGFDGAPVNDNLKGLLDRIGKAKADPDVKGLVLRFRDLSVGWAKAHELRQSIKDFRGSGKKVFAVLELAGNRDYLVASAADEVVMPESGWLMLKGLAAEVTFYRELFDKLGVTADMMQVGEFKGAGEPFTRTKMSVPFREEITSILTDSYELMAEAIAERKHLTPEQGKSLIDGGPYTPGAAKEAGLIDRIAYTDQLEAELAKALGVGSVKLDPKYGKAAEAVDLSGFAGFMKMMQALSGESARKPASGKPKVAIIHASGMIQTGKSSSGSLFGDAVMGSDSVIKDLRQAEKDPTVKAIVLRVDSPGGSALASDLIWREVVRAEKPIVASMSDVAASGGYYISMGCDKVFAEPGTLTGSIGVVGGKIALGGLMDKLGVTTDTVTVGKNGTIMSTVRPFTPNEKAAMRRLMEETYKQFVAKAAQGRKMEFDRLEKLAGGRVYTGRQARAVGLIDEIGTLDDAIAAAKTLAKLDPKVDTELLILPKAQGVLESLLGPIEDRNTLAPAMELILPEPIRSSLMRLSRLTRLLSAEPIVLVVPFEIQIQ